MTAVAADGERAGRDGLAGPQDPGGPADPVLAAEREHLARSRECLRLMREDVLSLPALAGDPVSREYLKAGLHRRAESLRDLPGAPLFFGRLDRPGERFHIGRRHVHDPDRRPMVVDWRAPVSRSFYRASQSDPMGLTRRRRFGFRGGELTAYEDEAFGRAPQPAAPGAAPGDLPLSRLVLEEIERPRSGAMRDIVATIQPDQDDIVRADVTESIRVQGAPGTGKTAVGLHRVAYLLYANRERMSRGGMLVLGPNRAFLSYIANVLPALGELDATQASLADLLAVVPVSGADSPETALVKGDARMAEVLRRALWQRVREPAEGITLARGSRRWRIGAGLLGGLAGELARRGLRYGAGREMLSHRIAHLILSQMEAAGEACDDRTHETVRRTSQVRKAIEAIWPKADPVRVVFTLLSDPAALARAADGVLTPAEQAALTWPRPPRGPAQARWTEADLVLIDEVAGLIDRVPSFAHIVIDEAQDLSPMACRAIARRCETGSLTVLGDIAQGTTPSAATSWDELLVHLGKPLAKSVTLTAGYRVPGQILEFASRLLPRIAPGVPPGRSLRHEPGALTITRARPGDMGGALAAACADALARPGSAAVITADGDVAGAAAALHRAGIAHGMLEGDATGHRLLVVPAGLAKGLEFDHMIVVEPAEIASAQVRGLHRLYVALTRAVSRLTVLHSEPLPAALA